MSLDCNAESWKSSWADGGRRETWSCERSFLVCFLPCSGKWTLPAFMNKTRSKRCLRKLFSAKFLNSDKIRNIWRSEITVNPLLLLCLQYLWTGDPSAVSRQLSSGAVSGESLDEVPGASSQGLWLLQHAAEETCPSAGDPAVWRARGSVRCPEEHQLDCAEKVKPQGVLYLVCHRASGYLRPSDISTCTEIHLIHVYIPWGVD